MCCYSFFKVLKNTKQERLIKVKVVVNFMEVDVFSLMEDDVHLFFFNKFLKDFGISVYGFRCKTAVSFRECKPGMVLHPSCLFPQEESE